MKTENRDKKPMSELFLIQVLNRLNPRFEMHDEIYLKMKKIKTVFRSNFQDNESGNRP